MQLFLDPGIDADALAQTYAREGRVVIEPFLAPGQAEELFAMLRRREDWLQVVNGAEQIYELSRQARAELPPHAHETMDRLIYERAQAGFQHRYETLRIPDDAADRLAMDDPLAAYAQFLSTGETRDLLRRVTGDARIEFADLQATSYSAGDFLTGHDDAVAGKDRSAAHVLSLNPEWSIEWGGLFLFHDPDGTRAEALVPGLNRFNLFRVPRRHSVSEVTRAAPLPRYALTGWLRRS